MRTSKKWQWEQDGFINGYNSVELVSWRALYEFLDRHHYTYPRYIFRGHSRASYELTSPLARHLADTQKADRQKYLEQFKIALRGRLPENLKNSDERELWILGHFHGLKTPLLAWTQAPYIAAFFAFQNERKLELPADALPRDVKTARELIDEPRSIYILNRELIEDRRKKFRLDFVRKTYPKLHDKLKELAGNLVAFNDPHYLDNYIDHLIQTGTNVFYSSKLIGACETATRNRDHFMADVIQPKILEQPRFISQACLFTLAPIETSLENWVQENFAGVEQAILVKINIPDEERRQCLKTLSQMNINHLTLYPDLEGAARYCNGLFRDWYR